MNIQKAINEVKDSKCTKRVTAENGLKYTTLFYRIKILKMPEYKWIPQEILKYDSKYTVHQIFNKVQESFLVECTIKCSKINYGLTCQQIRKLAYDYASKLHIKLPRAWSKNFKAGLDMLLEFMKCHPGLSIRKPEKKNIGRASSLNKNNVTMFFDFYEKTLKKKLFAINFSWNIIWSV